MYQILTNNQTIKTIIIIHEHKDVINSRAQNNKTKRVDNYNKLNINNKRIREAVPFI